MEIFFSLSNCASWRFFPWRRRKKAFIPDDIHSEVIVTWDQRVLRPGTSGEWQDSWVERPELRSLRRPDLKARLPISPVQRPTSILLHYKWHMLTGHVGVAEAGLAWQRCCWNRGVGQGRLTGFYRIGLCKPRVTTFHRLCSVARRKGIGASGRIAKNFSANSTRSIGHCLSLLKRESKGRF